MDSRLTRENVKGRVLAALQRGPLSNAQIREITQMSRFQVGRLMDSVKQEGLVQLEGSRRGARWLLIGEHKL